MQVAPVGRFQPTVFMARAMAMAECQRAQIVERVQDGLEAAWACGVRRGRKLPITSKQVRAIYRLYRAGVESRIVALHR